MKIKHCRAARARMLPFISGELAPENNEQMNQHLESCARCAAYAASLESTTEAIDAALRSEMRAPLTLDARVMATIRRTPARGFAWPQFDAPWGRARQLRVGVAVAGALIMGFVGGQVWHAPPPNNVAMRAPAPAPASLTATLPPDELAASYRLMKNGVMTAGASEARVAAQLRAIAPQGANANIELVALHHPDIQLVGGCWMNIGGHFVPSFCYDWKGKRVSIFQAPCQTQQIGMLSVQRDEVSTVSWRWGDRTFALVTEAAPEKSLELARQVDEI